MEDPICDLCGQVITEAEALAGDYWYTAYGEWHNHCIELYERERDQRAADDAMFKSTPAGMEIETLEKALEDLQFIILTATSGNQLKGIVDKVNEAVGYEPSKFEKKILGG